MIKRISILFVLAFATFGCYGQKNMVKQLNKTVKAKTETKCDEKGGYWYKGKCWATFKEFDEGIAPKDIDNVVEEQLALVGNYGVTVNGETHPISFFITEEAPEDNILMVITVYNEGENVKSILQFAKLDGTDNEKFDTKAVLVKGDVMKMEDEELGNLIETGTLNGDLVASSINEDDGHMRFSGTINDSETNEAYETRIDVGDAIAGMGDTTLDIKGDKAYLNGTLGTKGYAQFKDLIKNHPEVKTIVLQDVPGSINDAVNMHTGRIIREAGLTTMVLADSKISSGGVDLFCAGKERIVTKGAELGIHSWGGEGVSADDLAKDHPAHQYQIEYFTMCLGETTGPDFYFRTLSAAPAGEMHWMDNTEIQQKVATKFIEN